MPPQRPPRVHNSLGPLASLDPSARVVWLPDALPQIEGAVDNAISILERVLHPARRNLCLLLPVLEVMQGRVAAAEAVENGRPVQRFQVDQLRSECLQKISGRLSIMYVAVRGLMLQEQVQVDPATRTVVANSDDGISQYTRITNQVLSDCRQLQTNLEDKRRNYRSIVTDANICAEQLERLTRKINQFTNGNVKFVDHTVKRYLKSKTNADLATAVDIALRDAGRSVQHDAASHMLCLSSVVFPADVVPVVPAAVAGSPEEEQEPRMIFELICKSGCIDLVDRLLCSDWLDCPFDSTVNYGTDKFFEDVLSALFIAKPREQCYCPLLLPLWTWLVWKQPNTLSCVKAFWFDLDRSGFDLLNKSIPLWPVGETMRFTPGSAVGSVGPTLAQVEAVLPADAAIRGHFCVDRGVVTLLLLPTGDFEVRIAGASGRDVYAGGPGYIGGPGMILTYRVHYMALSSAPWRLIVGQQSSGSRELGGGGGGSFLVQGEELLLAAGGGSGGVINTGSYNASYVSPGRGIIANDTGSDNSSKCDSALGGKGWKGISKYLASNEIASDTGFSFGGGGQGHYSYGLGGGGGYSGGDAFSNGGTSGGSSYAHSSAALVQPAAATNKGSGFIEIKRVS